MREDVLDALLLVVVEALDGTEHYPTPLSIAAMSFNWK